MVEDLVGLLVGVDVEGWWEDDGLLIWMLVLGGRLVVVVDVDDVFSVGGVDFWRVVIVVR